MLDNDLSSQIVGLTSFRDTVTFWPLHDFWGVIWGRLPLGIPFPCGVGGNDGKKRRNRDVNDFRCFKRRMRSIVREKAPSITFLRLFAFIATEILRFSAGKLCSPGLGMRALPRDKYFHL